jgi:hypothetical protein
MLFQDFCKKRENLTMVNIGSFLGDSFPYGGIYMRIYHYMTDPICDVDKIDC